MRTRVRWAVLGLLGVLALSVAWTVLALVQARSGLEQAQRLLEQAVDSDEAADAAPELAVAQRLLEQAERRLRAPGPRLVTALPLAGRTVVAARDTAAAAAAVVRGGREVIAALPEGLLSGGRVDLDGLRQVEVAMRRAEQASRAPVARLDRLSLGGTPEEVADGVRAAREELSPVPERLRSGADGLAALRGVLGGDGERRLLVVLQNNAELRATGGLVSVFAEATARDGQLVLGGFQEVEEVADLAADAREVPAPADFSALFSPYLAATTLWKNVNMSADVPTSSAVLAAVAAASLPRQHDAIVWVDVPAIAAVLRATGPVALPDGSSLSADNAVRRLLSDAYANVEDTDEGQSRRRDVLRAAADAVLAQLLSPSSTTSAAALARELAPAAAGRHLAVWSQQEQEQRLLESAGLAGSTAARAGDLSSIAVHNLGDGTGFGNKLDYYSRRQLTVRVEVDSDEARVEQEVAIRNTAPTSGLPTYVSGRTDPGIAKLLVTFGVPEQAEALSFDRGGTRLPATPQPLGDHLLLTDVVLIPPGATMTWRLRYRVPVEDGRYTVRLFPQPLAVDAGLLLEVRAAPDLVLSGGPAFASRAHDRVTQVDVTAARRGWAGRARDSLRRFWNEPVEVPW